MPSEVSLSQSDINPAFELFAQNKKVLVRKLGGTTEEVFATPQDQLLAWYTDAVRRYREASPKVESPEVHEVIDEIKAGSQAVFRPEICKELGLSEYAFASFLNSGEVPQVERGLVLEYPPSPVRGTATILNAVSMGSYGLASEESQIPAVTVGSGAVQAFDRHGKEVMRRAHGWSGILNREKFFLGTSVLSAGVHQHSPKLDIEKIDYRKILPDLIVHDGGMTFHKADNPSERFVSGKYVRFVGQLLNRTDMTVEISQDGKVGITALDPVRASA